MKGRQVQFDDVDFFLNPFFTKMRNYCDEEGIVLKRDYTISESGKKYPPHKTFGNIEGKVSSIYLTYYESGFELFGEIKIDLEEKKIQIEFPELQIFLENNL
jgi:hypothetical protein